MAVERLAGQRTGQRVTEEGRANDGVDVASDGGDGHFFDRVRGGLVGPRLAAATLANGLRASDGHHGHMRTSDAVYSAYVSHNAPVFHRILDLYVPPGSRVADVTYGRGTFWKDVPPGHYEVLATDIQTGTDCRALPYPNGSVDALVLDPPYMEGMFRESHQRPLDHGDFRERYSQAVAVPVDGPKYHMAVLSLYEQALIEAHRVLAPGGVAIVKCQDEVSNHRQWFTHVELILAMQEGGFRMEDLFVVVRPDRPSVGRIKRQVHARKRHSYFLVGVKVAA